MCAAQLFGYGYLIYVVFSWDEIEPVTYLTGAFYACVSMTFYFRYREDFEWANAFEVFYKKRLAKICKSKGIDIEKLDFLKAYKENLEGNISQLGHPTH